MPKSRGCEDWIPASNNIKGVGAKIWTCGKVYMSAYSQSGVQVFTFIDSLSLSFQNYKSVEMANLWKMKNWPFN